MRCIDIDAFSIRRGVPAVTSNRVVSAGDETTTWGREFRARWQTEYRSDDAQGGAVPPSAEQQSDDRGRDKEREALEADRYLGEARRVGTRGGEYVWRGGFRAGFRVVMVRRAARGVEPELERGVGVGQISSRPVLNGER